MHNKKLRVDNMWIVLVLKLNRIGFHKVVEEEKGQKVVKKKIINCLAGKKLREGGIFKNVKEVNKIR